MDEMLEIIVLTNEMLDLLKFVKLYKLLEALPQGLVKTPPPPWLD